MKGIDISYAQGVFNWERAVETGVGFAMLKSSQGRLEYRDDSGAFEDPRFAWNAKECARHTPLRGADELVGGGRP